MRKRLLGWLVSNPWFGIYHGPYLGRCVSAWALPRWGALMIEEPPA